MDERPDIVAKTARRILPILMVCYFAAFLDRVNIGFAALTMNQDLGFSASTFGLGAGIFFLGYVLCELPSNLFLARVGARIWIARILITWGLLSAATAFVWGSASFYGVRVLLGAAEAGFFPGMIFYMTLWFPRQYRARMFATFNVAVPLASVIGAPMSGLVLGHLNGWHGLAGWQWMFILEALPAVIMGIVVLLALPDTPRTASFLAADERQWLAKRLDAERTEQEATEHFSVGGALTDPRVLLMCLIAVGLVMGTTGIAIWMPQFIKAFGLSNVQTSIVTAIPAACMGLAMIVVGRYSDRTGERVWHTAGPFLVSAIGFTIAALTDSPLLGLIGLTIGATGIGGASPTIWIFPTTLLTGTAAAAGIALINSVGSTGGFFGPTIIGWVRDATGGFSGALLVLAAVMAATAGALLVLGYSMRDRLRRSTTTVATNEVSLYQLCAPLSEPIGNALIFFDRRETLLVEVVGDLAARVRGVPLSTVLGGAIRDRVPTYASGPFFKPGGHPYRDFEREAEGYLQAGFRAIKLRSGFKPADDAAIALAIRRLMGPDAALMIDFNQSYAPRASIAAAAQMEEAGLLWIEEPASPEDFDGYRLLSHHLRPALAGGETYTRAADFQPFLAAGCMDVLQPDIAICGGLTGVGRVVALAEIFNRPVVPHVWGSTVNFHAALHLTATLPAYRAGAPVAFPYMEYDAGPNPLRDLAGRPQVNTDGTLSVPDGPGLGIDLRADMLKPFVTSQRVIAK